MRGSHLSVALYICRDFLLGAILLYGYIYTAYKYGNPLFGRNDFFRYEEAVAHPFDFSVTPAPFVLRQIPAIVAAAFYRLGIYWQTTAVIDSVGVDEETKRRLFAMILSNAPAVAIAEFSRSFLYSVTSRAGDAASAPALHRAKAAPLRRIPFCSCSNHGHSRLGGWSY